MLSEEAEEVRHRERFTVRPPQYESEECTLIDSTDFTKWKSSILVNIVIIASKTKTRLNDIRILYIYDAIHGLVPRCLAMRPPSILQLLHQHKRPTDLPAMLVGIAVRNFQTNLGLTGNVVTSILRVYTSSANVISPKSSSEQIISDNTSSTATPGAVENGPICSRVLA